MKRPITVQKDFHVELSITKILLGFVHLLRSR
jgi:hypothetical protein